MAQEGVNNMRIEISVPQQGLTTEYVVLRKWMVSVGQKVKKNMPVAEIESEKATLEIESPADGVLVEITAQVDDELTIQQVIGYVETG
jgi:pyruvate/2-oxoglutarate dehydrogenase complex dihydrolipoamide acyltransferase (E2) component